MRDTDAECGHIKETFQEIEGENQGWLGWAGWGGGGLKIKQSDQSLVPVEQS